MNPMALRLLTAVGIFTSLTIAYAQQDSGLRPSVMPGSGPAGFVAPAVSGQETPGQPSGPPPANAGPVEKARHYLNEKSFQLAVNTADEADTSTLNAEANRELVFIKAQAHDEMHQQHLSTPLYAAIIDENSTDIWAGRAHWQLQPGLNDRRWLNVTTSEPLKHLRMADEILSDLKPDDLDDFYMNVVNSRLVDQRYPEQEDRDYILTFFDRIIPLLAGQNELIAGVQLRRIHATGIQNPERTAEDNLTLLRGLVSEFPATHAAAQAQWKVAQYYINRTEYIQALDELAVLTSQFGGTDEARRAAEEIDRIKRPEALFSLPGQFRPGEKISFQLSARNTDSVRFTATPFNPMQEIRQQKVTRLNLQAVQGKPAFSESFPLETNTEHLPTSRSVILDITKPGAYVVRAEAGGKVTANALLLISDLLIVGNNGPQGYEFWTVDAGTGKPRANTLISIAHNLKNENRWGTGQQVQYFSEFTRLESGSDGFADFKPTANNEQLFAVATNGQDVAILDNIHWYPHTRHHDNQPMAYVYTDRPVYRPEQKAYWRAIIRERVNGNYLVPAQNSKFDILIADSRGQEIFHQAGIKLNEFGSFSGEIELPPGAPLGQYSIEISKSENQRQPIGHGQFRVEEYKKPEFEVSVESASDYAKVGDEIEAKVEAKYLFGSPVTDATVKYTVRRRPRYRLLWDNISWNLDDRDLGWFEDPPARPPTLHGSGGVIVSQGEGKVDANGDFTLSFDSTVPDEELNQTINSHYGHFGGVRGFSGRSMIWPPAPPTWEFQVEVTVTDASRRNIDASQVIPVGLKALQLAAKTKRNIVTPGDNARVELKSMNLAEKPIATSGTLFVEKLVWNESAKEDDITTVSTRNVAVEASGSLILDWRVPDNVRGRLRFAYIVDDPFGGSSVAYADFYAASPDDTDISARYQGVEIVTDQTRYTVGETAQVMILSEYKDAAVWYWIDTGSGNLHKQVLPLPHRTNFITIPITEAFVPNSMVHIVAVRDKTIISDEVELIVPPTKSVINVEITPIDSTVEPGQPSSVMVRATDENGQPASAEFSLSVFDQAITYIAPDMRPDIRKTFYGMKRPLRSEVRASMDVAQQYGGSLIEDIHRYMNFSRIRAMRDIAIGDLEEVDMVTTRRMSSSEMLAGQAQKMPATPPPMAMALAESSIAYFADDAVGRPELQKVAQDKAEAPPEVPAIRADFRDSMFWSPTVRTDAEGSATVEIKYPDSLTTWRMVAVGLTPDTRVGNATTETIARKKVLARLQAPRFFRERDEVTISANLHNYTETDLPMDTTLRVQGVALEGATAMPLQGNAAWKGQKQQVTVPAGGEVRIDWKVNVESATAGNAMLNLMALSSGGSDAMQTTVPLLPHGIDKFVAWNGTSRDKATTGVTIESTGATRVITQTVSLPAERIRETSRLEILVNPSLASSIREAIPYMIEYPYGCVEQTMSRFMPAAVAARAFEVLGYPLDQTLQEKLPRVTEEGLKRLRDMQLPSGSWGWWANDSENLYMTGYVVYGLTLARDAEVSVDQGMFDRGLHRLAQLRDDVTSKVAARSAQPNTNWWPGNLHDLMFAEYVLTLNNRSSKKTIDLLWDRRENLTAHGLAMLARTMGKLGRTADAEVVLRNMYNVAVITPENNTLRWGRTDAGWRWYDDAVEATAVGLMAYLELKPDDPAVDQAMKWLVLNRQGGRWKSTKDTAQSVLALTQYMLQRNESAKPVKVQVHVGDRLVRTLDVTPQNFWDFDGRIILRGEEISDGEFPVRFTVEGEGNIYYSIFAEYFTLEENIEDAGNEIYVTRSYEILHREQTTEIVNGKPSTIFKDKWVPLNDGNAIKSGDELRVTLKIKSLNDYEYLVFEDPKPAGMEPVDLQSGTRYGNGLCSNTELRDKWVAFFMTNLRQGEHTLTYNIRAEIPGIFHTMPTTGYAMYFPPLRANSDETIMKVVD